MIDTLGELAHRLAIAEGNFSKMVRGLIPMPESVKARIAKILQTKKSELFR